MEKLYLNDRGCGWCGKKFTSDKPPSCANCHITRYCNAKCQKADWWRHKLECESIQEVFTLTDEKLITIKCQVPERGITSMTVLKKDHEMVQGWCPPDGNELPCHILFDGQLTWAMTEQNLMACSQLLPMCEIVMTRLEKEFPKGCDVGNRYLLLTLPTDLDVLRMITDTKPYMEKWIKITSSVIPGAIERGRQSAIATGQSMGIPGIPMVLVTLTRTKAKSTLSNPCSMISAFLPLDMIQGKKKLVGLEDGKIYERPNPQ